jgi:hypothetical protein
MLTDSITSEAAVVRLTTLDCVALAAACRTLQSSLMGTGPQEELRVAYVQALTGAFTALAHASALDGYIRPDDRDLSHSFLSSLQFFP